MEKIIKIGKQEVKLNNNVAWTMEYRDQFGKDILPVIMPFMASMIEGVSTIAADAGELTLSNIAEALEGRSMDVLLPMFQAEFVDLVVPAPLTVAPLIAAPVLASYTYTVIYPYTGSSSSSSIGVR